MREAHTRAAALEVARSAPNVRSTKEASTIESKTRRVERSDSRGSKKGVRPCDQWILCLTGRTQVDELLLVGASCGLLSSAWWMHALSRKQSFFSSSTAPPQKK
eukprot:5662909-Pleurochrysis_carterae.AAC.3